MSRIVTILTLLFTVAGTTWAEDEVRSAPRTDLHHHATSTLPAEAAAAVQGRAAVAPSPDMPSFLRVESGTVSRMTTLLSSDFEGGFPSSTWTAFSQGASGVFWGRSTFRASSGNASAWCAASGPGAPGAGGDVPANTESWMIAGPFDLSGSTSGELAFDLWLETEAGFDFFYAGASLNGTNFTSFGTDQSAPAWNRFALDLTNWGSLGDLTGRSAVWFAFIYQSDGSVTREGAYVDNVNLSVDSGGGSTGVDLVINQIDAANCPQVQAIVSVLDDQGQPLTGLNASNFTLQEDGATKTFTVDTAGSGGNTLAVSLVLDGSGSMSNTDIDNIQVASNGFIDLLAPGDRVAVYHFGTDVSLIQDYTTDKAAARAAVATLDDNLGSTSLFDAIVEAANHSLTVGGRRALVVMTDGQDNDSSASQQDAIAAAQSAGVPVFTIGFGSANPTVLSEIANQTGGLFFQGATSGDLQTILNQIGQTLNNQFILTWTTTVQDGGSHNVTVQVSAQGATASRTATYSQAGTACATGGGTCTPNATTLCLNRDRFRVQIQWTDFSGAQGPGTVAPCGSDDSGLMWFFEPDNWEMLIKVLDGCGVNGRYWVFYAATTNVGYQVTVTDTQTNTQRIYTNPLGNPAPAVTDTDAFATCP